MMNKTREMSPYPSYPLHRRTPRCVSIPPANTTLSAEFMPVNADGELIQSTTTTSPSPQQKSAYKKRIKTASSSSSSSSASRTLYLSAFSPSSLFSSTNADARSLILDVYMNARRQGHILHPHQQQQQQQQHKSPESTNNRIAFVASQRGHCDIVDLSDGLITNLNRPGIYKSHKTTTASYRSPQKPPVVEFVLQMPKMKFPNTTDDLNIKSTNLLPSVWSRASGTGGVGGVGGGGGCAYANHLSGGAKRVTFDDVFISAPLLNRGNCREPSKILMDGGGCNFKCVRLPSYRRTNR